MGFFFYISILKRSSNFDKKNSSKTTIPCHLNTRLTELRSVLFNVDVETWHFCREYHLWCRGEI